MNDRELLPSGGGCACGNVSTAEQMIQLTDTVAPVWEFAPEDVTLDCSESFEFVPAVASDNCAAPSVTWSVDTLGDVSTGVYQVVFTFLAVDDCDNASEHEQVVNVVDTVEPMWDDFPADQVMSCDGDLDGSMPSASDACSDSVIVTLVSEEFFPGECEGSGNWVRTFSATDWNGNVLTSSQTVAVVDDVAPEFVSIPEDVVIECDEPMPTSMATASDNCSEPLVELSESLTDVINDGNYTLLRTFTATDACGNATSATQTVQVVDTIAPVILTELVDMTVECDSDFSPLELQVTDACSSVVEVSVTDVETPGACDGEWTVQRTYVVMDESGNADTTVVVLNVVDTTAPAWTAAPENITVSCDAPFPSNQAEAEDACSEVNVVLVQDTLLGNSEGNYQITQTWTATDACMNTSMWSRIVTVVDTAAPVVIYPADTTLACDQTIPVWEPLAGDNCGPIEWAFEDSVVSGNCPGNFSVVRHFTVTDDAGNESQGSQVISVVDNVAPSFSYVPDFEIWECNAPAELDSAVASDNCSGVELIANLDTLVGLGANQWTLMVTWTATDACGNSAQATQEIDVLDQLAPEIEAGPFDTTINWGEELLLDMWQNELVYSDSCSSQEELTVVVTTDTLPADTACLDQITLTWVVSDLAGNEAQWVQLIDLIDVDAPVWDAEPEDQTLACDEVWVPFYPEGSDHNVFSFTEALDTLAGACPAEFTITRTLVATDVCGNEALPWVQILTVVDTVAPIVDTWPADLVLTDPANVPDCESNALIWTDNCSDAVVDCATDTIEEFCPGSFLLERTYTVTDACGNVASVQQSILVEDVEEPVFEDLPNEVTYACDTTLSPPSIGELTITDNQSTTDEIVANVLELDSEGDECSSFTTFRYTAMDGCGNMTEVFYTQIREDNDAPVLTTPLEDLEFTCLGEVPSFDDQMFLLDVEDCQSPADGGPGYDVGLVATAVDEFEGGDCTGPDCLLTRTITVDDNCGNVAMFEQVIVVSEPPTVPELPTGFSPNNDSFNDVYRIRNAGPDLGLPPCDWLDNTTFTVFDRWGSVVYLSNDVSIPWDGTNISGRPLPVGTYFVVFEANGLTYRATVDLRR
ncbi:MAG: gliding motility-associated C-terminal domain-containing protein [Flavobacteriales bacterium]